MQGNGNEMHPTADVACGMLHATFAGIDACYAETQQGNEKKTILANHLKIVQFCTTLVWDNHVAYFGSIQRWHT